MDLAKGHGLVTCRTLALGTKVRSDGRYGTVSRSNYDNVIRDEDGEYVEHVEHDMVDVIWDGVEEVNGVGLRLVSTISVEDVNPLSEEELVLFKVMDS